MLKWDAEVVGNYLGGPAVFEDNSSYTFSFLLFGRNAQMTVLPECNEVTISVRNEAEQYACWELRCSEILYNDELPEEGGDCLVLNPIRARGHNGPPTHWIILARTAAGFRILTVFYAQDP